MPQNINRLIISLNKEDSSSDTVYCQKPHLEIRQHKKGTGMCLFDAVSLKGIT